MNAVRALAALAAFTMPVTPVLAGGYYYPQVYYYPQKVKEKVREVKIIERYIPQKENVSYLATIIPSNTYNITTNLPAVPAVQQAQLTASFGVGAQANITQGAAVQGVAAQQLSVGESELAAAIKSINSRLCDIETKIGIKHEASAPVPPKHDGPAAVGLPRAVATHCAACHNPADKAGNFDITGRLTDGQRMGALRALRSHTMPPPKNAKGVAAPDAAGAAEIEKWLLGN
jgi:hypothetical protein